MRRPGTPLTHEVLVEEARFILRTLQRDDLFGDRVRLTEAERVIDSSISLNFADYCGFLNKYGYVRIDQLANLIEVTEGGALVAQDLDDAEFHARLSRHFQRELGTQPVLRSLPRQDGAQTTLDPAPVPRTQRPAPITSERPPSPVAGEEVLDRRYRRGEVIGQGTIGTVYKGQHVSLGRRMAIKEARGIFQFASYLRRDEIVRRIRTTVEMHAALVHPNIIQIIDQNPEREYPYYVMELAAGGNLRQRRAAESEGQMSVHLAIRILLQTCYALQFAHRQNVLHLGLKPENILFDHLGNVKLSDFGFSRVTERNDESGQTPVLIGGGTVGYMAPERLQPTVAESNVLSPAADIYALGMIFYEMLTGKLPGRRSPLPSHARKDVPATFDDVFDRMTKDELSDRYRSVDQVLEGIYRAFPAKEVHSAGTILLWADDPKPLPKAAEQQDTIAQVSSAAEGHVDSSDQPTGEIDVDDVEAEVPGVPQRRTQPPPPPTVGLGKRRTKNADE
jgi:serine/threonine protein kinase